LEEQRLAVQRAQRAQQMVPVRTRRQSLTGRKVLMQKFENG
jgi:hypothetical protein